MSDMTAQQVELVSTDGETTGTCPKLEAHLAPGLLHRAVSVVIFDGDNRTLLQRRAPGTYHFANRWSNTCCTHPGSGEDPLAAARRRLTEEMGMTLELTEVGIFRYRAEDPVSGLVENEYDHVFVGTFTGTPRPNDRVVSDWAWASNATLQSRITGHPNSYTPWLPIVLDITRAT
jgi:isopentenyl-diphosphate delta-isomerase